jgi:hypothetical protein
MPNVEHPISKWLLALGGLDECKQGTRNEKQGMANEIPNNKATGNNDMRSN